MLTYVWAALTAIAVVGPAEGGALLDEGRLAGVGLTVYWEAQLPLSAGDTLDAAWLVDEAVYVSTVDGLLYSVTADTGLLRWGVRITAPGYVIYRPSHLVRQGGGGPALVSTTDAILALDRLTGETIRRITPSFSAAGTVVGSGEVLFCGATDGLMYSLRLPGHIDQASTILWRVRAQGVASAAPLLLDANRLVFASEGGAIYSCSPKDKALHWSVRTSGAIRGDPAAAGGAVFVAGMDRSVYRIGLSSGAIEWRHRFESPLDEGPIVTAHTVYQYSVREGLTALDIDSGSQRWAAADGRRFVAHHKDRDMIWTSDGRLVAVDHGTGERLGEAIAAPATLALVNAVGDAVVLAASDGRLVCARMDSAPYLRRQQILAARETLNVAPDAKKQAEQAGGSKGRRYEVDDRDPLRSRSDSPK